MLNNAFIKQLEDLLSQKIESSQSVSGGDISEAFVIKTNTQKFFLKKNRLENQNMFKTEYRGLQAIAKTNTITTPKVYGIGTFENSSFLLLEWIESKHPSNKDFKTLGTQLAQLHQITAAQFGFENNNFIGSLNQSNNKHSNWTNFYVEERLLPQLNLAKSKGLLNSKEIPSTLAIKETLQPIFENIKPSLLHGDLWSGNYLISSKGIPYLIDPAVYYGHNEVDIAMTKLFGGFSNDFYEAYFDMTPPDHHTNQRVEIYQLYYLLVHLNLFGQSYYGSVKSILQKYF
ncbi:fructosamine kinase family protein [Seonamhaeicola sediminis]|uniref:Fructosamine kinase family protein n=1 Tax=Seonamhaeicola sediminis TaxID=2528206 RepID=A0A562YCE0_9FLAO|nr:fructosamine kinase family protein [Seonamhaeicola sediminis]TWO31964.1 fructosamine kinase family protein [Seonamhaeicola sediminis]